MEDYLKAIFSLEQEGQRATTQALADFLDVAPASVTHMVKRLGEAELVRYTPYQGVELSQAGRKVAVEIVRHHRLLELYLSQVLGFSWDRVHAEAERLEHHISEELEARIDAALGYPSHDPHGHPIPTREGEIRPLTDERLTDQEVGVVLEVVRVGDRDPDLLRYLADLGVLPGVTVELAGQPDEEGVYSLRVGGQERSVSAELCALIRVQPSGRDGPVLSADHLPSGQGSQVTRLCARGGRLRRLKEKGLRSGSALRALEAPGSEGPRRFEIDGDAVELTREEARSVLVEL